MYVIDQDSNAFGQDEGQMMVYSNHVDDEGVDEAGGLMPTAQLDEISRKFVLVAK